MRQGYLFPQWFEPYIGKVMFCSVGNCEYRVIKDFHFGLDPYNTNIIYVSFYGINGKQGFLNQKHFENHFRDMKKD